MRRFLCALLLTLLCLPALAEETTPDLVFAVTNAGPSGREERPNLLAVEVTAADGSFSQVVTWQSMEDATHDGPVPLVSLVDYNFDGYTDLQLLAAQGAYNVYYAVALWDAEQGCFREVAAHCKHLPGGKIAQEITQAEFCNPAFYPDACNPGFGYILSVEADGYAYRTEYVYGWEARYGLTTYFVASVYDAGDGLIGESLEQWGTGIVRWWDQTYPESWYYGEGNASAKRTEARRLLMLGRGYAAHYSMMVDNVNWVNLRQLDSKDSPSLAKLDRGTTVQLLATGCGEDGGWMLVYVPADHSSDDDRELDGMTGYIWHSYLEPVNLYVANADWVNVREKPDKQSDVVMTLERGDIVYRCANSRDGWIGVSGWKEVEGFSDTAPFVGYIWHSYLEPEEFTPWEPTE